MLIDTHCHLEDILVLERARQAGVKKLITIGCDIETSEQARRWAEQEPDVYFSTGFHPHEAIKTFDGYLERLIELASHPKCVAIGECGLDYYYHHSEPKKQQKVFKEQIELAKQLNKTLIIHVRDAYEDCIQLLSENHPTVIHCFSGNKEHAKAFLDLGCYLSISGIVTFKNAEELREVVCKTPMESLLLETDAPWLAPVPYRGKPNEPAYVKLVAEKVAEIKNIPVAEVIEQTGRNAIHIFKFSV